MAKLIKFKVGEKTYYQFWCVKCEMFHTFHRHKGEHPVDINNPSVGCIATIFNQDGTVNFAEDNVRLPNSCHVILRNGTLSYISGWRHREGPYTVPMVDADEMMLKLRLKAEMPQLEEDKPKQIVPSNGPGAGNRHRLTRAAVIDIRTNCRIGQLTMEQAANKYRTTQKKVIRIIKGELYAKYH